MQRTIPKFRKFIFVCTKKREDAACCSASGSLELLEALKAEVRARGLAKAVRVVQSGCQDCCAQGPSVLLMPDHIAFQRVTAADIGQIVTLAAEVPHAPGSNLPV